MSFDHLLKNGGALGACLKKKTAVHRHSLIYKISLVPTAHTKLLSTYVRRRRTGRTFVVLPAFFCSSPGISLTSFRLLIKTVMATAAMA